jgi:hypothetical protein
MCTVFWDGLLHSINHPKARADSACWISHPGRFCQQNKTPFGKLDHNIDKYITLMKWAIVNAIVRWWKLKSEKNEWNSPHRWNDKLDTILYDISTLQMDEVNLTSIYFICMEFDDMYEINQSMLWNGTQQMDENA